MSVYSLDSRSPEDIVDGHPFLAWIVRMHARKSRFYAEGDKVSKRDFVLSAECSGRFSVLVEDGGLGLACQPSDLEAMLEVTWASAAFARGLKGRDYLILNCKDLAAGAAGEEVPLRVFLECSSVVAEALASIDPFPGVLRLRDMKILGGIPLHSIKAPRAEIPLAFVPVA